MRAHRLAAVATGLAGLLTIVSSLTANLPEREAVLDTFVPQGAQTAAHVAGVIGGALLCRLAAGIWQGRRAAARNAATLLVGLAVVHAMKGLDYEETTVALVLAVLLRAALRAVGTTGSASRVLLAALAVLAVAAGSLAFRVAAPVLASGSPLAKTGVHLLIGFAAASALLLLRAVLAPARARDGHGPREHARALAIVAEHGTDSIAPFVLRADKAFFFAHGGVLAYRTLRETAVVSGDPVGPPGSTEAIMRAFLAHAAARDWEVVLLGARPESLPAYRAAGLHTLQVGLEAIADPRRFDLGAPRLKVVRKAVRRVERQGWDVSVIRGDELSARTIADIEAVDAAWRRTVPRRYGFAMTSDRLWGAPEDASDLYALARNPEGELRGFQRYVRYRDGYSLDAMRRLDDHPNGISAALVAAALQRARDEGCAEMSLNFAGFGHLMAADALERRGHRVARWLLRRLHGRFQLERLSRFAGQFDPEWRERHLVYAARTRLPLAALRVLQAEAYVRGPQATTPQGAWLPAPAPVAPRSVTP